MRELRNANTCRMHGYDYPRTFRLRFKWVANFSATISYTHSVELVPSYIYPIKFHFTEDAVSMGGLGNPQAVPVHR